VSHTARELGGRFQTIGRIGWVAKGVIYVLIGVLAFQIAREGQGSGEEANSGGAVATLADRSYGQVLVAILGIGLALYVVWRVFSALLPGDWTGHALLERIGYMVSAVIYGSLAWVMAQIVVGGGDQGAQQKEDSTLHGAVASMMERTWGRWIVGLAALVVLGVAVDFAKKAWTQSFRKDISPSPNGTERRAIIRLGQLGWAARAVSTALIAFFLARAAITYDASEAGGIDGSLRSFVGYRWGQAVVVAVAVGFVAYGLFCLISARYQRLRGPSNAH
jgi:hypothetical protein